MKAAGALQLSRFGLGTRSLAVVTIIYLVALLTAPMGAALAYQSTGDIDLELDKSVTPELVEVGEAVTWTIVLANRGAGNATGVEVGDVLPAGLTYVSHSGDGTLSPTEGTWLVGDVDASDSVMLEIVTTVDVEGMIVNEAEVTMADQDDVDSIPGDGTGDDWDDATVRAITAGSEMIDLELVKSADPAAVTVGDETTWTIELTNKGPDPATGVEVGVAVPGGVTYVAHNGDGLFDPGSGSWTVGDVAVGQVLFLNITTTVDVIGTITCVAEVTMADQEDLDSIPGDGGGDDWDDATVTSQPTGSELIDLELTKSADPAAVAVGAPTTWTIDLVNQGPDDATGVEVGVDVPAGVTYVSHGGDGLFDPNTGTWGIGNLDAGASVSLDIVTTIDIAGSVTCVAEVTMADQQDVDSTPGDGEGDDWDDATVVATQGADELIDLELTKSVDPAAVTVTGETTWSIDLTNQGPDDATGVAVTVAPPAEVTYVSHDGDGSFDAATGIWTVGDLAVGAFVTLRITTTVDEAGTWTCVAEVTAADQEDVDSVPGDGQGDDWDDANVVADPIDGELIDLELTKTADPGDVLVGGETTWTIELTNQGPDPATGVAVTVAPPAQVTYVSHLVDGAFDPATGVWTVGNVAVGEVLVLEIATTVDQEGTWTCTAEVTAADQEDADSVPGDGEGDDWDDATVSAVQGADQLIDLELTKTADPDRVLVGSETTWTVELTNQGPDDATGVEVTVAPPSQVTYVSHIGLGDFDPGVGVWVVGDLAVGATVTLQIVTTVDESGTWTCIAEVTAADQEDVDSTPGDGEGDDWDDATVTAPRSGEEIIDLELTKTADPVLLATGEVTTWTIDLVNQGPDPASGVAVTVVPPSAATYVSHSGAGSFDPAGGVWTVGNLGVGETVTLSIDTSIGEIGIWTCVAEVTAADQDDVDSTPGDGEGDDWDDATVEVSSVLASAIVGDTVWYDTDGDGAQDAGEPGIADATVVLTNTDTGAVATQSTNSDGLYLFSALDPGNYTAALDRSSVDSKLSMTTPSSFTISLADNEAFLTADFGLVETLPVTGFDPTPITMAAIILMLLGAVALEMTWPERAGRRLYFEQQP